MNVLSLSLSLSLSLQQQEDLEPAGDEIPPPAALPEDIIHRSTSGVSHRLTPLVNEKTSQYARYIFEPVDSNMWSVVHEEGEMKVYRREMEEDGVVIDPLRANYTVNVRGLVQSPCGKINVIMTLTFYPPPPPLNVTAF